MPYKFPEQHPRFMVRLPKKESRMVRSMSKSFDIRINEILSALILAGLGTIKKPEDLVTMKILDESFEPKTEK